MQTNIADNISQSLQVKSILQNIYGKEYLFAHLVKFTKNSPFLSHDCLSCFASQQNSIFSLLVPKISMSVLMQTSVALTRKF